MFPIHVKTASGLEPLLAQELKNIGLTQIKVKNRLVIGLGDLKLLYQINLWSRTAIRALLPLTNFNASDEKSFYDQVKALDWSPWIKETGTLAIDAHVHSSFTTHSLFLAQLTKDAIADHFREKTGTRPSVDLENPDLRIAVNLFRNQVEIFLDSSGDSLHKRGYRQKTGEAPLNETLAAGIIQLTRWDGTLPLVDPMTGSGTLAIEAALIAKNIAPGLLKREFGFQKWK
ncbi:MAG: class I SAM-dependent RNA methyltransferase, partial [Deltaproteobacteria bacterium]